MKLILTVLLLIVLPTAMLSLLAGRSLQARELLIERQLELEALQTLEQISAEIMEALANAHGRVEALLVETVLRGGDIRQLPKQVASRLGDEPLLAGIYLFMNPWGFVYPEESSGQSGPMRDADVLLQQELASRISAGRRTEGFEAGQRLYRFRPIATEPGLYVGFEIDAEQLTLRVRETLRRYSTGYVEYALLQVGVVGHGSADDPGGDVQVADSLSAQRERVGTQGAFVRERGRRGILVSGHLRSPFDYLEIGGYAVNAADMHRAQMMQSRLVGWGIILLAVVITASTMLLIVLSRRQAEEARRRGIFMAGLSHDIRTPVAGMRALAESLRAGRVSSPERQQQFLDSIVQECDRLSRLIERVLLFFRQEQRVAQYHKALIRLSEVCEEVAARFREQQRGRVSLVTELPDSPEPYVWADPGAVEQVLYNLLDNAQKYGGTKGVPGGVVSIRLRVRHEPAGKRPRVLVAVEDDGPGVSAEDRHRIFRRFYRGESDGDTHTGGIGLGLALVAEILRAHDASVQVRAGEKGGAVFELSFKVATG